MSDEPRLLTAAELEPAWQRLKGPGLEGIAVPVRCRCPGYAQQLYGAQLIYRGDGLVQLRCVECKGWGSSLLLADEVVQ